MLKCVQNLYDVNKLLSYYVIQQTIPRYRAAQRIENGFGIKKHVCTKCGSTLTVFRGRRCDQCVHDLVEGHLPSEDQYSMDFVVMIEVNILDAIKSNCYLDHTNDKYPSISIKKVIFNSDVIIVKLFVIKQSLFSVLFISNQLH